MRRVSPLEAEVKPPWPFRLQRRGAGDGTTRVRDGVLSRLLHVGGAAVVVNAWQLRDGNVRLRATPAVEAGEPDPEALEVAIERLRFALGVDDDYRPFYEEFRSDPVLGPAVRRRPWVRVRRRPWPWEALASAIAGQLIDAARAKRIERRIVRRWGPEVGGLRDVPSAEKMSGRAPAELEGMDLAGRRAIAMIRCARDVAAGRCDLGDPASDERLLAIREIGPWTVQCLGLNGRGDHDSLPAGDLAYVKLVGRLAGLGRRAEIPEIEAWFERYAPYRGLAGSFISMHYHHAVETGPPLRLVA
jgi:3-methyladenine DNA glycosylase/8-oxoguanine DNA glycosylase